MYITTELYIQSAHHNQKNKKYYKIEIFNQRKRKIKLFIRKYTIKITYTYYCSSEVEL